MSHGFCFADWVFWPNRISLSRNLKMSHLWQGVYYSCWAHRKLTSADTCQQKTQKVLSPTRLNGPIFMYILVVVVVKCDIYIVERLSAHVRLLFLEWPPVIALAWSITASDPDWRNVIYSLFPLPSPPPLLPFTPHPLCCTAIHPSGRCLSLISD